MFFFEKDFEKCSFLLSTILSQYIRHWLGKTSLPFIGSLGGGSAIHFWTFLGTGLVVGKETFDFS